MNRKVDSSGEASSHEEKVVMILEIVENLRDEGFTWQEIAEFMREECGFDYHQSSWSHRFLEWKRRGMVVSMDKYKGKIEVRD